MTIDEVIAEAISGEEADLYIGLAENKCLEPSNADLRSSENAQKQILNESSGTSTSVAPEKVRRLCIQLIFFF